MRLRAGLLVPLAAALALGGHGRAESLGAGKGFSPAALAGVCAQPWLGARIHGCPPPPTGEPEDALSPELASRAALRRELALFQSAERTQARGVTADRLRVRALLVAVAGPVARLQENALAPLAQALEAEGGSPAMLSDLAALYLVDAERNDRPLSLVLGLDAALRATAQATAPVEAFHNQALLLERLYCRDEAAAAWRAVLAREREAGWERVARDRLHALQRARRAPAGGAGLALRDRVWRELLPSLDGMAKASIGPVLAALESATSKLATGSGDTLLAQSVVVLQIAAAGDSRAWHDLAKGHALFERGYAAYQRGDLAAAHRDLGVSADLLDHRGSPFRHWPRFYLACALQQEERYAESLQALGHLHREIAGRSYWSLLGYVSWMEGQDRELLGRPLDAIAAFRASLAAFERSHEIDNLAAVHALQGECLLELGRQEDAWVELREGLRLGQSIAVPRRAVLLYSLVAEANRQYQRPRVARLFQNRSFAASDALHNPKITYLSLLNRGFAAAGASDLVAARQDLQLARSLIADIGDVGSRRRAIADLAILGAVADPARTQQARVAQLSSALAVYRQLDYQSVLLISAHEERARLLAASGDVAAAAGDLAAALDLYELRITSGNGGETRWSLHADAQRAYDRLIALELDMGRPDRAFAIVERSRQLSLHSDDFRRLVQMRGGGDATVGAVRAGLADREALVLFKELPAETLIWILRRGGARLVRVPFGAAALRREVADFADRLRRGASEAEVRDASRPLFDQLFANVFADTDVGDRLILVPDRDLFDLPAAAVFTPSGQPLGTLRPLLIAPSVEVYLRGATRRATAAPVADRRRALVVSNPSFDARAWPGLPPLPGAAREGAAVASLYRETVHLAGGDATLDAVLRQLSRADVFHFAGHAVVNARRPDLSLLLLAPQSSSGVGALYQRQIYQLALARSPVVVLGACDSASLMGVPGEGLSSLAHAFLSAGASAVVGSLWPVRDDAASSLMVGFHEALQRGLTPERALQQAQERYLGDGARRQGDPWGWAAFQVIGAKMPKEESGG